MPRGNRETYIVIRQTKPKFGQSEFFSLVSRRRRWTSASRLVGSICVCPGADAQRPICSFARPDVSLVHIQVRTLLIRTLLVPIRTLLLRPKSKVGLKGPVHGERIDSPARGACGRACRLASRAGCIRTPHSTDSECPRTNRYPLHLCLSPRRARPGVFERFTGTVPVFTGCEVLLCDP